MIGITVQLPPDLEKQLDEAASQGRISKDELVRDVLAGYLQEAEEVRSMLKGRYDDLETGRVQAVYGKAALGACERKARPAKLTVKQA